MSNRSKFKRMTEAERNECLEKYKAGATRYFLAEFYNRDLTTIDKLIKRKNALRNRKNLNGA